MVNLKEGEMERTVSARAGEWTEGGGESLGEGGGDEANEAGHLRGRFIHRWFKFESDGTAWVESVNSIFWQCRHGYAASPPVSASAPSPLSVFSIIYTAMN